MSTPQPGSSRPSRTSVLVVGLFALAGAASSGCASNPTRAVPTVVAPTPPNWKERLEQPYLYVEQVGDYRRLGDALGPFSAAAERAGVAFDGPVFVLFYDDPAEVDAASLRARLCVPIEPGSTQVHVPNGPTLLYDVLPRAMVAYARTSGGYPSTAPTYAALFDYLAAQGWSASGPVREVYLATDTASGAATEVQVPWIPRALGPAVVEAGHLELPVRCR